MHMSPDLSEEEVRKALHRIIDDLTKAELYSLGDRVIVTRHHTIGDTYVSIMASMNKER